MLMDYQKLYCLLFNAITNALEQIDLGKPETARIIFNERAAEIGRSIYHFR